MQDWVGIALLLVAALFILIAVCEPNFLYTETKNGNVTAKVAITSESPNSNINGQVICYLTEYEQPPDDNQSEPSQDELQQINDVRIESFRGKGPYGRGGSVRAGARRKGPASGYIRHGGGGGGRHGGRPWRRWPRRHWNRPWRSYLWRTYPDYIYTYPLTYYKYDWTPPVERYSVRIGPKQDVHPFFGKGSNLGYMITAGKGIGCGASGARLDLKYGRTYEFDIYTANDCVTGQRRNEPFFFTTDPKGGAKTGDIFTVEPTVNGTIRITITNNLPRQFYYQSTNSEYVGGYVFLS